MVERDGRILHGDPPARSRIGLVGCVKEKAHAPRRADRLYTSALFRGRAAYVASTCDRWFILSALHGLVEPEVVLEPYDVTLVGAPRATLRTWAGRVITQLEEALGPLGEYSFELHAGAPYREFGLEQALAAAGAEITNPTAGLRIGAQLAFYAQARR